MTLGTHAQPRPRPFLPCVYVGGAAVIMSLVLMVVMPRETPGMPEGFTTPILAFEFAATPADLYTLFGATDTPARRAAVAAMDLGNKLDFVYLVLYPLFLGLLSAIAARRAGWRWLYVGAGLAVVVAIGDALENVQLLALTAALDGGALEPALSRLRVCTWIKWGGLAALCAALAPFLLARRTPGALAKIAGAACLVAAGLGALAWTTGRWHETYALAIAAVFVLLFVFTVTRRDDAS